MLVRRPRRRTPSPPRPATRGSASLAGALAGGLLAAVHAYFVLNRALEPARHRPGRAVPRARPHVAVRRRRTCRPSVNAFEPVAIPGLSSIPWIGDDLLRAGPAHLPVLRRWCRRCGGSSSAAGGACCCGPPASAPRCSPPTATGVMPHPVRRRDRRRRASPASAAPSCRSPTPTPGSRTWSQGRGFIAVAVVIFAARQPFKVAAGAYLFGAALALSPALQARGLRHQPVRPRRDPVRRSRSSCSSCSAAAGRPTPPRSSRRSSRPPPLAGTDRAARRTAPHPSSDPGRANPGADTPRWFPRKETPCADVGSPRLCSPLLALVGRGVRQQRPRAPRTDRRRHRIVERRPARQGRRRRSASSSSARRTTSATTRPPTRAPRPWPRPTPTSRCSPPRTCPRTTTPPASWSR